MDSRVVHCCDRTHSCLRRTRILQGFNKESNCYVQILWRTFWTGLHLLRPTLHFPFISQIWISPSNLRLEIKRLHFYFIHELDSLSRALSERPRNCCEHLSRRAHYHIDRENWDTRWKLGTTWLGSSNMNRHPYQASGPAPPPYNYPHRVNNIAITIVAQIIIISNNIMLMIM